MLELLLRLLGQVGRSLNPGTQLLELLVDLLLRATIQGSGGLQSLSQPLQPLTELPSGSLIKLNVSLRVTRDALDLLLKPLQLRRVSGQANLCPYIVEPLLQLLAGIIRDISVDLNLGANILKLALQLGEVTLVNISIDDGLHLRRLGGDLLLSPLQ